MGNRQLPPPARAIAEAVGAAVAAAEARDRAAFEAGAARLAALNPEQVGAVLGAVVRSLLEELHPDGLSAADVQAVLQRCVRAAAGWRPDLEPGVMVVLLTAALGVHHADDQLPAVTAPTLAAHAPLLVADLLAAAGQPLDTRLAAAFAEISRAETMELP